MTVPKLVRFTTPITIPITAQAAITDSACLAPSSNAFSTSFTDILVSFRNVLTITVKMIVYSAA